MSDSEYPAARPRASGWCTPVGTVPAVAGEILLLWTIVIFQSVIWKMEKAHASPRIKKWAFLIASFSFGLALLGSLSSGYCLSSDELGWPIALAVSKIVVAGWKSFQSAYDFREALHQQREEEAALPLFARRRPLTPPPPIRMRTIARAVLSSRRSPSKAPPRSVRGRPTYMQEEV